MIFCFVMAALLEYEGSTTHELELLGKKLGVTEDSYIGDFSEDIRRFPIVGTPKNYSKVHVKKNRCMEIK